MNVVERYENFWFVCLGIIIGISAALVFYAGYSINSTDDYAGYVEAHQSLQEICVSNGYRWPIDFSYNPNMGYQVHCLNYNATEGSHVTIEGTLKR